MKLSERITNATLRLLLRIFLKINIKEFEKMPKEGPFIIIANHTSALDGPLMYVFMQPRNMVAMAKKELWNSFATRYLMNLWSSIPVDRENMERKTLQQCFDVLNKNNILAIAPEGTRSVDGSLQEGKEGVAFIAYKQKAPMVPIVTIGLEDAFKKIRRFKRAEVTIKIGKPFEIIQKEGRLDADKRSQIIDEVMGRLKDLLPPSMHGYYADKEIQYLLTHNIDLN